MMGVSIGDPPPTCGTTNTRERRMTISTTTSARTCRPSAITPWRAACVALALSVIGASTAQAATQSVAMTGGMGSRALLVINGAAPRALAAGDVSQGVKVISVGPEQTVVEIEGKRQTVRLGGAPVRVGGSGGGGGSPGGSQIALTAVSGGHFVTQGSINGRTVDFMVDTGATSIAMGADEAKRIGLKYENGQRGHVGTANGVTTAYKVTLAKVRIQDVEVYNVEAVVMPSGMSHVLLGNTFLSRFQMRRDNDQLTLTKRF